MSAIWEALVPPADASVEELMRHRTVSSIALFACICGLLASWSMYAKASDVEEIQVQLLEERMLETRLKQCKALADNNEQAKQYYWERLNDLMSRYYHITERNYNTPSCQEIL